MAISEDGSIKDGPYTARWVSLDSGRRTYQITWFNGFVDTVKVAPDGRSLNGQNMQGVHVSAIRSSAACGN